MQWIAELTSPDNSFPTSSIEKAEILNFAVVAVEQIWLYRNRLRNGEQVPSWDDFSVFVNKTAKEYWKASVNRKIQSGTSGSE